ncbi:hypothetical protein F3Y22_tig00111641pilonHSYRG00003 [Hibiscus syriacus]|uniref:Uncharacterized protein n=1 Tax=Hibiscus syriacus TaxID=106335 RepID=A0A6A2YI28_HIBSY|nr:hypothetical protein F3Y22_tig00111641pilonHSYRG00003 [Hibiscus syriacus]
MARVHYFWGSLFLLHTFTSIKEGWASAGVKLNILSNHTHHFKANISYLRKQFCAESYEKSGNGWRLSTTRLSSTTTSKLGPRAPPMQQAGYGYMQPGGYPGPSPQYNMSQPPYGGYPSQPSSGGYASGWDQSMPPNPQSSSAGGYDYYNQQSSSQQQQAPGQGYGQDGYGGYNAPPQSGYGQPSSYDQQGYGSAPSYGASTDPSLEGQTPSYAGQGDSGQAPTSTQPSAMGQQGYNTSQMASPNPGSYPPQGSTQAGYGMPPTSQAGYGSQPPAQSGYGGYGPAQGKKPLVNNPAYGQTQQSPTTPGSYGQQGYHSQPPSSGYGQPESGSQRAQSSTYGAASVQPGYAAPPYGAPYNASYASGYSQPPAYPADGNASGSTHGTYEAAPASQTGKQDGGGNASPQS